MKTVLVPFAMCLLVFVAGCQRDAPDPAAAPAAAAERAARVSDTEETAPGTQNAICKQSWTCDHVQWYGTQAACFAYCGPSCELDYRCTAGCVCP